MAVGKEIKGKIRSVKNTQKITKAMEMVAASKMRKAQDRQAAATSIRFWSSDRLSAWASLWCPPTAASVVA